MIRALLLDFGNVISQPQDLTSFDRMASHSGLDSQVFIDGFYKYRQDFDRGILSGIEMYRNILLGAGFIPHLIKGSPLNSSDEVLNALAEQLLEEDFGAWMHINEPVTQWALSLQKSGLKLGILSNIPFEFLDHFESEIKLFTAADATVFSCREKLLKPEPEMYQIAISRLGCAPEEIVFFDDLQPNIDAARALGIQAFLWNGLEQGKRDWDSLTS